MYSRTILLTAASLAVAGMANAASATAEPTARAQASATLHLHHYRLLSDPHFVRGQYVAWHASIPRPRGAGRDRSQGWRLHG